MCRCVQHVFVLDVISKAVHLDPFYNFGNDGPVYFVGAACDCVTMHLS